MSKKQTEELSKSKAKRQERQKEVSKAKRHKLIGKIVGIVVAVVIIAAIVAAVGTYEQCVYLWNERMLSVYGQAGPLFVCGRLA